MLLRLLLAPVLVGFASLAARRWGDRAGGWIAALPFVAGPLLFIVALEQGARFAAQAATTAISGIVALAVFALVYARICTRQSWWISLLAGWASYMLVAALLRPWNGPVWERLVTTFAGLWICQRLLPSVRHDDSRTAPWPYDLPVRMVSASVLVATVAGLARAMGPAWSGLLAPFPVATTILVVFSQLQKGPEAVSRLLQGFLPALAGLVLFFAVLSRALELGIAAGFCLALLAALAAQGAILALFTFGSAFGRQSRSIYSK
jgi:hypothetical protein